MNDVWTAKTNTMRCGTCMYFVVKLRESDRATKRLHQQLGRCRRHAPTMRGYPVVYPEDWCGDHKLDSDKM